MAQTEMGILGYGVNQGCNCQWSWVFWQGLPKVICSTLHDLATVSDFF